MERVQPKFKIGDVVYVRRVSYRNQDGAPYKHGAKEEITFLQVEVIKTVIKRIETWAKPVRFVCLLDDEYSRVFGTIVEALNEDIPVPEYLLEGWRNQAILEEARHKFNITTPQRWSVLLSMNQLHAMR